MQHYIDSSQSRWIPESTASRCQRRFLSLRSCTASTKKAMALRAASSLAPSLRALAAQRSSAAFITTSSRPMDMFSDKEKGDEQIHFRKEDERLMRQLLEKVKAAADKVNPEAAKEAAEHEISKIKGIIQKYKMSDDDVKELLSWKHSH